VNETYGYEAGDRVLTAFGRFLMECTRASDIPARVSGSKFAVILPDTSKRGAYTMVERFAQALSSVSLTGDERLDGALVVTFGVSGFPWSADTVAGIVQLAETELAAQKPDAAAIGGADAAGPGDAEVPDVPDVFRKVGGPTGP
jgi:diguanylate cyclase (GGDEF)-like protein